MKSTTSLPERGSRRRNMLSFVICFGLVLPASGQTQPEKPSDETQKTRGGRAPTQPFEVNASKDVGYVARATWPAAA